MEEILKLSPNLLIAFGTVWVISLRVKLTGEQKFWLSALALLVVGFVPADLGNEIANKVKDAIGGAVGLAAAFQGVKKITGNV